mgnify:CR=1 FL=1
MNSSSGQYRSTGLAINKKQSSRNTNKMLTNTDAEAYAHKFITILYSGLNSLKNINVQPAPSQMKAMLEDNGARRPLNSAVKVDITMSSPKG